MEDSFSFQNYNTENLVEETNPELLKNIETTNPALSVEKEKNRKDMKFIDIPKEDLDFLRNSSPQNLSYSTPQSPISIPFDNGSSNSYLTLVLNPNFRELELMIRGLEYVSVYNPATDKHDVVLQKVPNHPLNEYGINQIITQLRIYCSPEIKLGRKRARDYYNSVQHVSKTVVRLIYKNLKNFGMDTQVKQRNAKVFCNAIVEMIDASFSRSIEGKENDLSRATEMRIEGSLDGFHDPARAFNRQQKEQLKN